MSVDLLALAPPSGEMSGCTAQPAGADVQLPVESSPSSPARRQGQALVKRVPARAKPPKDSKVYKTVLAVIAMRAQGVKMKEIGEALGHSEDVLRQYLSRAYKRGWINTREMDAPDDALDLLKSKVVRNVEEFLDQRDKDVTVETAKGVGLFKTHQVMKGETTQQVGFALRVQVEMPPMPAGQTPVTIRPGTIGGARGLDIPIEAEVIEEE